MTRFTQKSRASRWIIRLLGSKRRKKALISNRSNDATVSTRLHDAKKNNMVNTNGFSLDQVSHGSEGYDTKVEWLVERIIPSCSVGFLVGETQSFKSFISVAIASSIASGYPFGTLKTGGSSLVIYVAAEGGIALARRVKAWEDRFGEVGRALVIVKRAINLANINDSNILSDLLRKKSMELGLNPSLIVIDTFSQCSQVKDENSAAETANYLAACTRFATEHRVCVLNVHHCNKRGGIRGSSAIISNADFVLTSKRATHGMETSLAINKLKDGDNQYKVKLEFDVRELGFSDEFGKSVTTLCPLLFSESKEALSESSTNKTFKQEGEEEWLIALLNENRLNLGQSEIVKRFAEHFSTQMDSSKMPVSRLIKRLVGRSIVECEKVGKSKKITLVSDINLSN